MNARSRRLSFAALLIGCVTLPVLYVRARRANVAAQQPVAAAASPSLGSSAVGPVPSASAAAPATASLPPGPRVLFRYTGPGPDYGRLVHAPLEDERSEHVTTPLACERVHFAAGSGVCLAAERGAFTSYEARLFDRTFRVRERLPLSGSPSRARVSPDGRYAAFTLFESGHSYAAASFSTRTSIVGAARGDAVLPDLERLTMLRDGSRIEAVDFNFWGVTFAKNPSHFYATLATGGDTYLVEGNVEQRAAKVLRGKVECPALSPDNTKIAFKLRKDGPRQVGRPGAGARAVGWQLAVLDLATGSVRELAETRSVDDQVDWLSDAEVLYALPDAPTGTAVMNTWVVRADGSGAPRLFRKNAYSLVVIRG